MTDKRDPLEPKGSHEEEDPLIDVLMRLAAADFNARAPRTFDGGRRDTLAYLINTVSEELARVVWGLKAHEENLDRSVQMLSEVLASHAAGDFSARAPRTEDGSPLDVLAFIINNTGAETGRLFEERNQAFEKLKRAKETEAVSRAKSAFLANVSHELRTPLTLILGPLHSVLTRERQNLPESIVAELETVLRNAGRLSRMVNDVLDFTRAEEGKTQPVWQWTDAAGMVDDIVRDLRPIAVARDVHLESELVGPQRDVALDRRMFEKILINLVGNALKFTPAGGRVRTVLEFTTDQIELRVCDTGIGIPAEQCERIFDRFHQVDTSQTRQFEGSGLGLALVREFATSMGGRASVESTVGTGSTFCVTLPTPDVQAEAILPADADDSSERARFADVAMLSDPVEVPTNRPSTSPADAASGEALPYVLVAEDNPDMQRYIGDVLGPYFEVCTVSDGAEALAALDERTPDVIVSDVMMPNVDGFELVRQVKANPEVALVPVVLLTARAGSDASVEGLDVGADDYLAKPFRPRELVARVRAAARLRATGKRLAQTLDELQVTKSLVLRMGQVDAASALLAEVGHRVRTAVESDDRDALCSIADELTRLEAPVAVPTIEHTIDLASIARELLGQPLAPGDRPVEVASPRSETTDALACLLDELAIPRDGSARLRVVEGSGDVAIEVEATPTREGAMRPITGPLRPRPDLHELLFARAHLRLLHCGIETQLTAHEGGILVRLAPN